MVSGVALHALPIVRAHNLVLLAGLAGNGFAAYLLAWTFTRRAMPAVVAGTSFATCSYLSVHLLGHVNLTHAWVLPVACLAWNALLDSPGIVRALGIAVACAAAAYTDYYYAIYTGLFMVVWAAVTLRDPAVTWIRRRFRILAALVAGLGVLATIAAIVIRLSSGIVVSAGPIHISALHARNPTSIAGVCAIVWVLLHLRIQAPRSARPPRARLAIFVAAAGAICLVLVLPVLAGSVRLIESGDYSSQQYFWRSAPRGVDLVTLVAGPPMHGVTGTHTTAALQSMRIDRIEQTGWLGIVASVLTVAAMLSLRRLGRDARRWAWIAFAFFAWSLGPSLAVAGQDTGVLLPQSLARFVPIVSNARMPGRAFVMVQLASSVLGALVLSAWSWSATRCALLAGIVVLESAPVPFPTYALPLPDRVDAVLVGAENAVVVEIPTGVRDGFGEWGRFDHRALVHQMTHGQRLVGGFLARLPPSVTSSYRKTEVLARLFDWSEGAQDAAALPLDLRDGLRRSGVQYLVVEQDVFSSLRPSLEQRGLRMVASDHGRELYSVE